jgi:hypothetical protein
MVEPISIIGAIVSCKAIAGILYDIVKDSIKFGKDVEALEWRFKFDTMLLDNFQGFFEAVGDDLKEQDLGLITSTTVYLQVQLEAVGASVKRYKKKKLHDRAIWDFVKDDMMQAEANLREWCNRMQTQFLMLPYELRQKMGDRVTSPKYQANKEAFSGLLASLHLHEQKELSEMTTDLDALLDLKKEEPPENITHTDGTTSQLYKKHTVAIPYDVSDDPSQKREMEVEVARLVKMFGPDNLMDADADQLHIPRAVSYFERPAPVDRITKFGIVYEMPKHAQDIFTLKDIIREASDHVRAKSYSHL